MIYVQHRRVRVVFVLPAPATIANVFNSCLHLVGLVQVAGLLCLAFLVRAALVLLGRGCRVSDVALPLFVKPRS